MDNRINLAQEMLTTAFDILNKSKWVNHSPNEAQHCSITPIDYALDLKAIDIGHCHDVYEAYDLACCVFLEEANRLTDTKYRRILDWNDQPERKRNQVNQAYKNAIKRLKDAEELTGEKL